jgi:hypothetical protein
MARQFTQIQALGRARGLLPGLPGARGHGRPGKTLLTSGAKRAPGFTSFSRFRVQNRAQ